MAFNNLGGIAPLQPKAPQVGMVPGVPGSMGTNPTAGGPVMTPPHIIAPPPAPVNYNPGARDVALRNLGTQTPAAPTAQPPVASPPAMTPATPAPADSPPPASAPPPVAAPPSGSPPAATGGTTPLARPNVRDMIQEHQPEIAALIQQARAATDPAQSKQLIDQLRTQLASWRGDFAQQLESWHNQMLSAHDARHGGGDFGSAWDQMDQQDQASAPATPPSGQADSPDMQAARLRRQRTNRASGGNSGSSAGIYTGN